MVNINGQWDLDQIGDMLPIEIVHRIMAMVPPHAALGNDRLGWCWESHRAFSTKPTYTTLGDANLVDGNGVWNPIWHLNVPQKGKGCMDAVGEE
ncbi:hypothetical protein V6N12_064698 [Hibiscus sabdariffa]|uniref:Uncharacterized protein n=1 Tax=Hibiscus sabdariffa TaxID=183260 RepID=A0ABR2G6J4_9ROSI